MSTECPGKLKCHGPASWCNECGDVDLVCDDPNCEVHLRFGELKCAEKSARLAMDAAHEEYKVRSRAWDKANEKLRRFTRGNVVMVARKS